MKTLKSLLLALFLSFSTLGIVACVDGGNESESYTASTVIFILSAIIQAHAVVPFYIFLSKYL